MRLPHGGMWSFRGRDEEVVVFDVIAASQARAGHSQFELHCRTVACLTHEPFMLDVSFGRSL